MKTELQDIKEAYQGEFTPVNEAATSMIKPNDLVKFIKDMQKANEATIRKIGKSSGYVINPGETLNYKLLGFTFPNDTIQAIFDHDYLSDMTDEWEKGNVYIQYDGNKMTLEY